MKTKSNISEQHCLLFDQIDRQIIISFYEKSKTKSKFWAWYHKPLIVTRYEATKAQRELSTIINKLINSKGSELFFWVSLGYVAMALLVTLCIYIAKHFNL